MKILLVCAGGLSSSIVMKKVRKYGEEIGEDIQIDAVGVIACEEESKNGYDCVLTAPQVRNRFNELKSKVTIPIDAIPPQDYAIGNAEKIVALAKKISNNEVIS